MGMETIMLYLNFLNLKEELTLYQLARICKITYAELKEVTNIIYVLLRSQKEVRNFMRVKASMPWKSQAILMFWQRHRWVKPSNLFHRIRNVHRPTKLLQDIIIKLYSRLGQPLPEQGLPKWWWSHNRRDLNNTHLIHQIWDIIWVLLLRDKGNKAIQVWVIIVSVITNKTLNDRWDNRFFIGKKNYKSELPRRVI